MNQLSHQLQSKNCQTGKKSKAQTYSSKRKLFEYKNISN